MLEPGLESRKYICHLACTGVIHVWHSILCIYHASVDFCFNSVSCLTRFGAGCLKQSQDLDWQMQFWSEMVCDRLAILHINYYWNYYRQRFYTNGPFRYLFCGFYGEQLPSRSRVGRRHAGSMDHCCWVHLLLPWKLEWKCLKGKNENAQSYHYANYTFYKWDKYGEKHFS